jgi:predicted dehydrogenase
MLSENGDRVRLGLIGLGWWGGELTAAAERGGAARVVSCFARDETARDEFSARHGVPAAASLDEMLGDPTVEGVLIATPHQSHRPLVEQAAAAGKHVFVEKPLTTTIAEGRICVAGAREAGVLLQVGHQRRRTAANRRIKEMLESDELGDVETVIAHQSVPNGFEMPETAWRWSREQSPLGSMASLGIHKIDTMHYLVGPIARVSAFTRGGRNHPIDEATVLALEFESGALATLTTSFFTPVANDIAVFGTLGAAYNTMGGAKLSVQMRADAAPEPVDLPEVDPVVDELVGFAKAIRGEGPVEPDGEGGLATVAVLEAALESARTGRAVEVADLG